MDFRYEEKNRRISNSYYNQGLEKAQLRDLSGAVIDLKKSLHFDKFNINARNLLGLIFYEMGEVADALVQWVISMNILPDENIADHYLEEVQRKRGRLENAGQNIKKYNQALTQADNDSDDLAILLLNKAVEENPNFIKAQLLLALLCIKKEDYTRAGKALIRVLRIDHHNNKALQYMAVVKENTGKAEIEKKKLKNAFSHRKMQDDDIIIPPTYKESTGWQMIIHILAGLLLGVFVIYFLVIPAKTKQLNYEHNEEIKTYTEKLNTANLEIDNLKKQIQEVQNAKDDAEEKFNALTEDNGGILKQYQGLIAILQSYRNDDFTNAVKMYSDLDFSLITEPEIKAIADQVAADMAANGYPILETLGDKAEEQGDDASAIAWYHKCLNIKGDEPQVIYKLALLYQKTGDTTTANDLFNQIIKNFPNSEYVSQIQEARGY